MDLSNVPHTITRPTRETVLYIRICYSFPPAHIISQGVACSVWFDLTPFSAADSLAGSTEFGASVRGGCPLSVIPLHLVFPKFPKVKSVIQQLRTEPTQTIRGGCPTEIGSTAANALTSYRNV